MVTPVWAVTVGGEPEESMVTAVRNWVVSARTRSAPLESTGMTNGDQLCIIPRALTSYPTGNAQFASVTTSAAEVGAQVQAFSSTISPDQFWKAC